MGAESCACSLTSWLILQIHFEESVLWTWPWDYIAISASAILYNTVKCSVEELCIFFVLHILNSYTIRGRKFLDEIILHAVRCRTFVELCTSPHTCQPSTHFPGPEALKSTVSKQIRNVITPFLFTHVRVGNESRNLVVFSIANVRKRKNILRNHARALRLRAEY